MVKTRRGLANASPERRVSVSITRKPNKKPVNQEKSNKEEEKIATSLNTISNRQLRKSGRAKDSKKAELKKNGEEEKLQGRKAKKSRVTKVEVQSKTLVSDVKESPQLLNVHVELEDICKVSQDQRVKRQRNKLVSPDKGPASTQPPKAAAPRAQLRSSRRASKLVPAQKVKVVKEQVGVEEVEPPQVTKAGASQKKGPVLTQQPKAAPSKPQLRSSDRTNKTVLALGVVNKQDGVEEVLQVPKAVASRKRAMVTEKTEAALSKPQLRSSDRANKMASAQSVAKEQDEAGEVEEPQGLKVVTPAVTRKTRSKRVQVAKVVLKKMGVITSPTVKLRRHETKNYAETSLETPKNERKVPVYQRHFEDKKRGKKKVQNDLYQFDSDSEELKTKKRGKLHNSSCDEYNKTIENILRNVMKGVKDRNAVKNTTNKGKLEEHNKVVNNNQKGVRTNTKCPPIAGGSERLRLKKDYGRPRKRKLETPLAVDQPKAKKLVGELEKVEPSEARPKSLVSSAPEAEEKNTHRDDDPKDLSFGFESSQENENIPEQKSTVSIISNVLLKSGNKREMTPSKFGAGRPNANSTACSNVLTPWRFNEINIKRKPYFLSIKKNSSLPSMRQDMPLDHTIVDHLDHLATPARTNVVDNVDILVTPARTSVVDNVDTFVTPARTSVVDDPCDNVGVSPLRSHQIEKTPKKKLLQRTLTDYFSRSPNKENKENETVTEPSLFDNDDFSPIKNRSPSIRKVLESSNRNNIVHRLVCFSTPVLNKVDVRFPDVSIIEKSKEAEASYFGFDSTSDNDDQEATPKRPKDDKPYRLSVSFAEKKYVAKKRVKIDDEVVVAPPTVEDDSHSLEENNGSDDDSVESHGVGLFEDFHTTEDFREKGTKKKKQRLRWLPRDDDDKPKTRRKDVRTKKEEEDAEKWAEEFNSMCKEVEDFPLEIE